MKRNASSSPEYKSDNFEKMLQRAAGLCSRQEQCTSHIREKLKSWNVSEKDEDQIIQKLTVEKFLDDGRYAGFYARDKFKFNGWGRIRISHMLRQKNVDEEHIENALMQIDEEDWFNSCLDLVRNKHTKLVEEDAYKRKGKLLRFAAGRGFEPDLIYRALDQLEKE